MTVRSVVVTGATGFVGGHVVRAMHDRVGRVKAIVRATSDTAQLKSLGVEVHAVSLESGADLAAVVSGADVVVHLAALTHARSEIELQRVNGEGTAAIADAAIRAGEPAKRIVYLSSLAAVGPSAGIPVNADTVPAPLTAYGRSKLAGEVALSRRSDEIQVVTLRAPAVYGPGDRELLRFFKLARVGVLPLPAGPDRPLQLVHVEDLARGIVDAVLEDGLTGTFNVAEKRSYGWRDVCELIGAAVERKPMFLPVPRSAIEFAAIVSESMSQAIGRSTMFSRDKVRELLAPGWLCETDSARSAFGFEAMIPLAEGLRSTADWYRTKRWL